jgi:hypothetical protein
MCARRPIDPFLTARWCLVSMKFRRPASGMASPMAHRRHRIGCEGEHQTVGPGGAPQAPAERRAGPVNHTKALRARFAAIRPAVKRFIVDRINGALAARNRLRRSLDYTVQNSC